MPCRRRYALTHPRRWFVAPSILASFRRRLAWPPCAGTHALQSVCPLCLHTGRPAARRLCSCSSLMFAHGRKHLQDLLYLALSVVPVLVNAAYGVSYTGDRHTRAHIYDTDTYDYYILTIRVCITALVEAGGDGIR